MGEKLVCVRRAERLEAGQRGWPTRLWGAMCPLVRRHQLQQLRVCDDANRLDPSALQVLHFVLWSGRQCHRFAGARLAPGHKQRSSRTRARTRAGGPQRQTEALPNRSVRPMERLIGQIERHTQGGRSVERLLRRSQCTGMWQYPRFTSATESSTSSGRVAPCEQAVASCVSTSVRTLQSAVPGPQRAMR